MRAWCWLAARSHSTTLNDSDGEDLMMNWLLVAIIVAPPRSKNVLQAIAMRRHGEIHDFRPGALGRVLSNSGQQSQHHHSIVCSGISFFAFLRLVAIADLSFAVPATPPVTCLKTISRQVYSEGAGRRLCAVIGAVLVACGVALLSW